MIRCIIVDDEPLAIELLENHIAKIKSLKLVGKAKDALEAYHIIQNQPVDLVFLDIHMPNLSGVDFLKTLHPKPKTIFTTAYREYALEGFELEVIDYLLKPITFDRFFKSVDRVLRNLPSEEVDFIVVKADGFNVKIPINDVMYLEGQSNDIKIILQGGTNHIIKGLVSDFEKILLSKGFVRVHRSFVINTKYVLGYNNHEILLDRYTIPVGRNYKKEFNNFVAEFTARRLL